MYKKPSILVVFGLILGWVISTFVTMPHISSIRKSYLGDKMLLDIVKDTTSLVVVNELNNLSDINYISNGTKGNSKKNSRLLHFNGKIHSDASYEMLTTAIEKCLKDYSQSISVNYSIFITYKITKYNNNYELNVYINE
jgi:hypothetical protein